MHILQEVTFWAGFFFFNALHFLPNYVLNFRESSFLPYWTDIKHERRPGLADSKNQDLFRYVVELSAILLIGRLYDLSSLSILFGALYLIFWLFNWYQYMFRRIYESEPKLYNDVPLLGNGITIVWHESPWKLIIAFIVLVAFAVGIVLGLDRFLNYSVRIGSSWIYLVLCVLWFLPLVRSLRSVGFYRGYPSDLFNRYHFTSVELAHNIRRGLAVREIARARVGEQLASRREGLLLKLGPKQPNIYFIFVESYGSYLLKDKSLSDEGMDLLHQFQEQAEQQGRQMLSNYSASPTTGGQSWSAYSSFLYGIKIADNTHFEKYLRDPHFHGAKSILQLFQSAGYVNYNLNPISPIKGINVPYDAMRKFYSIDHWFLKNDLRYLGDVYGFGECPPDQYSLNFAFEYIQANQRGPFTLFYLTKNSHSPFVAPSFVEDWRSLNDGSGKSHTYRGFLAKPRAEDYLGAMSYEFKVLSSFIDRVERDDIVLLIGDHQPPMLADPEIHGFETPVHLISTDVAFLQAFEASGFQRDIEECRHPVTHEGLYSIFVRAFGEAYGVKGTVVPPYEPHGFQFQ